MKQTLVEKLISRSLNGKPVTAGDMVLVPVDRLLINDYVGAIVFSELEKMNVKSISHPERVLMAIDHCMPAFSVNAADQQVYLYNQCKKYGIARVGCPNYQGIGHQLMVENFTQPYEIALGTDSHATMYAGVGAFSCGITATDAVCAVLTGNVWIKVPESLRIQVDGSLRIGVTPKDLALALLNVFEREHYIYRAVEIVGDAINAMSMDGRLVIANLMAEAGIKCVVMEADEKAFAFAGTPLQSRIQADAGGRYVAQTVVDASRLNPVLAYPHAVVNVKPLEFAMGKHVDQVFIGSCTNGRVEDFEQAAEILKGRHVAQGTRLLVVPASRNVALDMVKSGIAETLMEAGAIIMNASCASCAGHGPGLIGAGECCVSTTNRNFKGRMGSADGMVYLGSAYTAAACAVEGRIVDPRKYL